jgi:RNA polymerase sigma-70 factor (ECF subfamily)
MGNEADNLEAIYRRFHHELMGFVERRVGDREQAEDIVQEIFVRIQRSLSQLETVGNVRAWLYRITRNAVIDHYRTRRQEQQDSVDPAHEPPAADSPAEEADFTEHEVRAPLVASLREMLGELPEKYRVALELHELEGLPQEAVARRLSLSVPGAKSRIQRARKQLREEFLACCRFELDPRGGIVNYEPHEGCCGSAD